MSYAPDHIDLTRRAATYIDKILKGTKPADLPVEQASRTSWSSSQDRQGAWPDDPGIILLRTDEVIE